MRVLRLLLVAMWFSSCASQVLIPPEQRAAVDREVVGTRRYLRVSMFVTPFFGDAGRRLLTDVPPAEVRLLNHPNGSPVNPGEAERTLAAGTPVRVAKIEFPTAFSLAERVPYTPRTQPWVYVEVDGGKHPPYVIVLRPQIKTQQELSAELERYLTPDELSSLLAQWSDTVREGVRLKKALVDMPIQALEMAWGYPERKKVRYDDQSKVEEWHYADNLRVAHVVEGKVVRLEGPDAAASSL